MSKNSGFERRKFTRIPEEDILVCEPFDAGILSGGIGRRKHVVTKNLSEGGLLFESGEMFEMGTILKLQIDIPGWEKYKLEFVKMDRTSVRRPLVALGKVVRVEDIGGGLFDIGVAFAALDNQHKLALKKYFRKTI